MTSSKKYYLGNKKLIIKQKNILINVGNFI
jgi:hypothetical protein